MTLENYIVTAIDLFPAEGLTGRRKILTPVNEITAENVKEVLAEALDIHAMNAAEIGYLWNYYKGKQDIRNKRKQARPKINNKVTINRANEIVTFKTAYLLNEPIQYVSYGSDKGISDRVNRLNEYMRAEDKESKDKEIVDWMHIGGVAERLVLPDPDDEQDGAPFCVYTIDPRDAFVIYNAGIGQRPIAGVIIQVDEDRKRIATLYTKDRCFTVKGDTVTEEEHVLGGIPLVEYVNNDARMGSFETVISILNNINLLESNAVDSVEDFVNGFDVFQNCDIEDGAYSALSIGGKAVKVKTVTPGMEAKVYRVASELTQGGVQTRINDFTDSYLTICGMPNRNGGSSTSDTGTAVIMRDGWSEAESRAKDSEKTFTRSEREFLRIVLNICATKNGLDLRLSDIKTEFLRKNLANLQSKVQVLCELLNNPKVHPKLAFEAAALFKDNEEAYRISSEYYEQLTADQEKSLREEVDRARDEALRTGGQSAGADQSNRGETGVTDEANTAGEGI